MFCSYYGVSPNSEAIIMPDSTGRIADTHNRLFKAAIGFSIILADKCLKYWTRDAEKLTENYLPVGRGHHLVADGGDPSALLLSGCYRRILGNLFMMLSFGIILA
jgi:hypothetical protein